jgi:thiol:disulfide interchange protein DsbD
VAPSRGREQAAAAGAYDPAMTRLMLRPLTALLVFLLLAAGGAAAQPGVKAAGHGEEPVVVRAVARHTEVRPGDTLVIAVVMQHGEGYHTWPHAGVPLPAAIDEFALRTKIGLGRVGGDGDDQDLPPVVVPPFVSLVGIQWPEAHPAEVPDFNTGGRQRVPLFSGTAVAFLVVKVAPDAPAGEAEIPVGVFYQACDEQVCLPPQSPVIRVRVTVSPGAGSGGGKVAEPALFAAYDPGAAAPPPAEPAPAQAGPVGSARAPSLFGLAVGGGTLVLFLAAALGGAILNLTPCVLPVIPIKIMTLVQHAGTRRRRVTLGLWMALGVVAFWFAIGLPMALVNATLDPSRLIFGTWWVTLSLGLLIAAMGLGVMGLFSLNLPQSVYLVSAKADTPTGSFMFGVMTAVLGLPCFGFVAGGLLAGAATLPASAIMVIFTGLGVGMAAPYLVLAVWPALLAKIPRTGPASELVKQVMGLLLLAAAAYFVAAGLKTLLLDKPHLKSAMGWWAAAFFVVLAGAWLSLRILRIARRTWPKVVMPAASLAAAAAAVLFAAGLSTPGWLEYDRAAIDRALKAGKIVVADFTADWCINCKVLKRTVLDRDPVRSRLEGSDVARFEVDLSSTSAPGWAFLNELGYGNVPTLAIFGPGLSQPIVMNAYTPATVLDAIERAKGPAVASAAKPAAAAPPPKP